MPHPPRVSVILPTHDRPGFLRRAVDSVLGQTFRDLELLVVDDASRVPAAQGLGDIHDERLKVIRFEENKGAPAARNAGLCAAAGRYIAFLDDDDELLPRFLERMTAAMDQASPETGVLFCGIRFVDPKGACVRETRPRSRGNIRALLLKGEKDSNVMGLIRRECLVRVGGFDEALRACQDWDLWLRLSGETLFDGVDEVLAVYHSHEKQLSGNFDSLVRGRTRMLEKHYEAFAADPRVLVIHLKRLGKLHALNGTWHEAWSYFKRAIQGDRGEFLKIAAWLCLDYPRARWFSPMRDFRRYQTSATLPGRGWEVLVVLMSLGVTFISQQRALLSPYVMNDDICQHIWWMRVWQDPVLFRGDLMAAYAASFQHLGELFLFRMAAFIIDPLVFAKGLVLVLAPLAAWALFRWVLAWTKDAYTGLLAAVVFMVTPLYLQHMTGGHAHVFGFPLMALFMLFLSERKWHCAAWVIVAGAFLFPVISVVATVIWGSFLFGLRGRKIFFDGKGVAGLTLLGAVLAVIGIMVVKFLLLAVPAFGVPLSKEAVMRMPELGPQGRWAIWPVEPFWRAFMIAAEQGVFLFKAIWRSSLALPWKQMLMGGHFLLVLLGGLAAGWWWRMKDRISAGVLVRLSATGICLYLATAPVMLKLYAPDRYLMYVVPLAALLFFSVPAGLSLSALQPSGIRRVLKAMALVVVLSFVPLVRGAGLFDYRDKAGLYAFLGTLPKEAVIAAHPVTADAIPAFSRRKVFANAEMGVPLYDAYWQEMKSRTFEVLSAYYAAGMKDVQLFVRRNGITHFVIDREQFTPAFMSEGVYVEPFASRIKDRTRGQKDFALLKAGRAACIYDDGRFCVLAF